MFSNIDDVTVEAPGFDDPQVKVRLGVDASWVRLNAIHARLQPLLDFWALVKGMAPPINCIGYHEGYVPQDLRGLSAAHALFCGLKRPLDDTTNGDHVHIFLTSPPILYGSVESMVCLAKARPAPKNAVFACYVRRYEEETQDKLSGRILAWEWVKADDADPLLPQDFQDRYQLERWRR